MSIKFCDVYYHSMLIYDPINLRGHNDNYKPWFLLDIALRRYNPVIHSSVCFRRCSDIVYNNNFIVAQDYELWCRLVKMGKRFYSTPKKLGCYVLSDNSISSKRKNEQIKTKNLISDESLSFKTIYCFDHNRLVKSMIQLIYTFILRNLYKFKQIINV